MRNLRWLAFATMLLIASGVDSIPSAAQIIALSSTANNSQVFSPVHYVASATSPNCLRAFRGCEFTLRRMWWPVELYSGSFLGPSVRLTALIRP